VLGVVRVGRPAEVMKRGRRRDERRRDNEQKEGESFHGVGA
jgi:hypothetical protein